MYSASADLGTREHGVASMASTQDGRFRVNRIQKSVISRRERQLLDWLCARMPASVMPDHLTVIGVAGAVLVFASYVASSDNPGWLWLASVGFVVHWFGDSLDGSLARHRRTERPIYGYFLDHTVDAVCNLLVMTGLGFTPWVRMDVALFTLIGYYLLCMYVFINNHVSGIFQLSFIRARPTELRLGLIGVNTWMFFAGWTGFTVLGKPFSWYDALLMTAAIAFTTIFVVRMLAGIRELRDPARNGTAASPLSFPAPTPSQSASRKSSSRPK